MCATQSKVEGHTPQNTGVRPSTLCPTGGFSVVREGSDTLGLALSKEPVTHSLYAVGVVKRHHVLHAGVGYPLGGKEIAVEGTAALGVGVGVLRGAVVRLPPYTIYPQICTKVMLSGGLGWCS